jgi:hypothetical protein
MYMIIWFAFGWLGGQFLHSLFIFLRDLRGATRLEAKVSVFDLGPSPRSTVQSQLHDFSLDGFLSGKCGKVALGVVLFSCFTIVPVP